MSRSKKDKVGGHCTNIAYGTKDLSGWAEILGATGVRYAKRRHTRLRRRANKIDKRQLFLEDYIPQEEQWVPHSHIYGIKADEITVSSWIANKKGW